MRIAGQLSTKEEAHEITLIAKLLVVGERARYLGKLAHVYNKADDKIRKMVIE